MAVSPRLLKLLRCPVSGLSLRIATPDETRAFHSKFSAEQACGSLQNAEPPLVREDGGMAYPVCGGIPVLLPDTGVPL